MHQCSCSTAVSVGAPVRAFGYYWWDQVECPDAYGCPSYVVVWGSWKNNRTLLLVHIPVDYETIELTVGHTAYGVRLLNAPYLNQEEKEVMELTGKQRLEIAASVSLISLPREEVQGRWVICLHKSSLQQPSLIHSTREVLLTDLGAEVTALGMKAECG